VNLMEDRVRDPLTLKQFEEGRQGLPQKQLTEKFGNLPAWAEQRLLVTTIRKSGWPAAGVTMHQQGLD
jgi:hypothetical protein